MKYRANYMLLSFMLIAAGALNGAANKSLQERCAEIIASDPTVMPKSMHLLPQVMQLEISGNRSGPLTLFVNNALLKRIGATLQGRISRKTAGIIKEIAFSPDGTTLASASSSGIRLWNPVDGTLKRKLHGVRKNTSVAFSPDGTILASGGSIGPVKIWSLTNHQLLRTLDHSFVKSVAFSPDGPILASGSYDGNIKLWNPADGALIRTITPAGYVGGADSIAFNADGTILATGRSYNGIDLLNPANGNRLRNLAPAGHHPDKVRSIAFSPDGTILASGTEDGKIRLWNPADGTLLRTIAHAGYGAVESVTFSPDGTILASAARASSDIRLWNPADGTLIRTIAGHRSWGGTVGPFAFSPNGAILASATTGENINLWRIDYQQDLRTSNIDRATQQVLYLAAKAWNHNQPLVVPACNPGYQTLIKKLPYLNDNRLFTVLSREQAELVKAARIHYRSEHGELSDRRYIIRAEDLATFESLPDALKTGGLFFKPSIITPAVEIPGSTGAPSSSSDSAASSSTLQDDSATPPRDVKRTGREEEVEDVSNKRQR